MPSIENVKTKAEMALIHASEHGDLDAIKKIVKAYSNKLNPNQVTYATSWAITGCHFHCFRYLMDNAWHTFSAQNKSFTAKIAAFMASKDSDKNQQHFPLAYILKKYKPTLPEGTIHKLKTAYPLAFDSINKAEPLKIIITKPVYPVGFLPMFKHKQQTTNSTKINTLEKPKVFVNILEEISGENKNVRK